MTHGVTPASKPNSILDSITASGTDVSTLQIKAGFKSVVSKYFLSKLQKKSYPKIQHTERKNTYLIHLASHVWVSHARTVLSPQNTVSQYILTNSSGRWESLSTRCLNKERQTQEIQIMGHKLTQALSTTVMAGLDCSG